MGQTSFSCQIPSPSTCDILSQQLQLYQWRADTTKNAYIPRVTFKNAFKQKQQEILAEIIGNQKDEGYLQIYKIRDISSGFTNLKNEEIVLFQKYQCTLDHLYGTIRIGDAFYVLNALLIGFQEIRRFYQEIIVQGCCCFVTIDGEVRAWINPNYRSNQLWTEEGKKIIYQRNVKQILIKILSLTERLTISSFKSQQFFRFSFDRINGVSNLNNKQWHFSDLRRYIHHFCHENFIEVGKNLKEYFHIISQRRKISQITRASKLKDTIMHISTSQTQDHFNKDRSLLVRSKSLENHHQYHMQCPNKINQIVPQHSHSSTFGRQLPLNSCIIPQRNGQLKVDKSNQSHKQLIPNNPSQSQVFYHKSPEKPMMNLGKIVFYKKQSVKSQYASEIKQSPSALKLQTINKSQSSKPQIRKNMQVSIMQNLPSQNPREGRHRTCVQSQQMQSASQAQMYWSRPWITTKTITRLISEGDEESIKQSIAESSDYYNQSDYSGALTHLARDVAGREDNRSKTVRISKRI